MGMMEDGMDRRRLIAATDTFLARHWNEAQLPAKPTWSDAWKFVGAIHHFDSAGCYALFAGERLLYVGQTLSPICFRTGAYTRMAEGGRSVPTETRPYVAVDGWAERGLDAICTLPIPSEQSFLVRPLKAFLIGELNPPFNVRHVRE